MRKTQRAPKSCKECSARKIKCNQVIPCQPCIKRGTASRCTREVVLIRGVKTVARDDGRNGPIRDSVAENQRQQTTENPGSTTARMWSSSWPTPSIDTLIDDPLKLLPTSFPQPFISSVKTWDDITLPTREQSIDLIQHGKLWTSWIHCAIYYREFEAAHDSFLTSLENGETIQQHNPSWLAIYFALLAAALLTRDEGPADFGLFSHDEILGLMRNWYSASLYCLELADYMRNSDFMNVQAISILQMCCNAVGDYAIRSRLMATGIQIANDLGMPFGRDPSRPLIHCEISRRLWWVFVVCEWFFSPSHRPCISEDDFDMIPPLPVDDDELESGELPTDLSLDRKSPWVYHVCLTQTAVVNQRFNTAVRGKHSKDVESLVREADEGLANIIDNLPLHLQPYGDEADLSKDIEEYPWMRWQRVDLTTNLFLCRARINYQCRKYWSNTPKTCIGQRIVCLEAARSVILLFESSELPIHQRRYMTYTLRLYSAGLIIASEIPRSTDTNERAALVDDISKCIQLLEQAMDLNIIAERAVEHLKKLVLE